MCSSRLKIAATTPTAAAISTNSEALFTALKCKGDPWYGSISIMSSVIDHIVLCVEDLDEAADEIERILDLESQAGGRHSGHGTANRIVPLGSSYLELVAVVDAQEASSSPFGDWVGSRAAEGLEAHAVCLRSDDLEAVCGRLGLNPVEMSRTKPNGTELRWRLAGLEEMISLGLPFYIEWAIDPSDHPGRSGMTEEVSVEVTLRGDPQLLATWTAGSEGVSVESGRPGIEAVRLRFSEEVIRL